MAKLSLSRKYQKLEKDHKILLDEALKAGEMLKYYGRVLDKYRLLAQTKDKTITRMKKLLNETYGSEEAWQEKMIKIIEEEHKNDSTDESTVRDGENPGGELHNVADGGNEEVSHADESYEGGAGESEGSVRDGSSDEA